MVNSGPAKATEMAGDIPNSTALVECVCEAGVLRLDLGTQLNPLESRCSNPTSSKSNMLHRMHGLGRTRERVREKHYPTKECKDKESKCPARFRNAQINVQ